MLKIENLTIAYHDKKSYHRAVNRVDLSLKNGSSLAIVGESGCGKTTICLSILKLLPKNAEIVGGKIRYEEMILSDMSNKELEKICAKEIAMIFQGAMNALNPVKKISTQILEVLYLHDREISKQMANQRLEDLFSMVELSKKFIHAYPHQLSGGMRQRAMIAMALALQPKLLIADEPTTALDVMVQAQIINLLKNLQKKNNMSLLWITHDLSIVDQICDDIAVMFDGKIMEKGPCKTILSKQLHPYAKLLMEAFPVIGTTKKISEFRNVHPSSRERGGGCVFYSRCPISRKKCLEEEPLYKEIEKNHFVACHQRS